MAMTLGEMIKELEQCRYDLAVWMTLENSLCKYVDQDKHRQAEAGLKVKGCSLNFVPNVVFERTIDRIRDEEIEPLQERIAEIESLSVQETDDDDGNETTGKDSGKKEVKVTKKKSRRKGRPGAKGIRSISGRARQKGAGSS